MVSCCFLLKPFVFSAAAESLVGTGFRGLTTQQKRFKKMKGFNASLGALALCALLASCGGGGGGGSGGGSGGASGGSWLTFSPAAVDIAAFPGTPKTFTVSATSTKTIEQRLNIGVIDTKGVITPNVKLSSQSVLQYNATLTVNPTLAPGVYSGNFEIRACYDASPVVCSQPVEGSPWQVPYTIKVVDPATLSYSKWEVATTSQFFLAFFQLSYRAGNPVVLAPSPQNGQMETFTSVDVGTTWTKVATNSPTPPTRDFALATDNTTVYLSGGQSINSGAPSSQYQSDVWKFDGTTWQLKTSAAAFAGREKHVMAKVGSALYVAGGRNAGGALRDVWRSVDEGATWAKVSDTLPEIGTVSCALEWQGTLLLVGDKVATSVDGVTWNVGGGYPTSFPKGSTQCAVLNGKLFINAANANTDAVSTADLANWQLERSTTAAPAPGMAPVGGRLVVTASGGSGSTFRTVP